MSAAVRPDDHDARGRFAPGNGGGPGNPFGWRVAAFRMLLLERTTKEEFEEVRLAVVKAAKEGNMAACRLFFQYLLGKPLVGTDPDELAFEEQRRRQKLEEAESRLSFQEAMATIRRVERLAKLPAEVVQHYMNEPEAPPSPDPVAAPNSDRVVPSPPPPVNGAQRKLSRKERKRQRELARQQKSSPSLNGNFAKPASEEVAGAAIVGRMAVGAV
jgi:hypothetical protein